MGEQYRIVDHEKPFQYKEGDFDVTRGCAWTGPGCHLGCGVVTVSYTHLRAAAFLLTRREPTSL